MKLKNFTQMKWSLFLLFCVSVFTPPGTMAKPSDTQEMKFLDAVREISQNFDVYFSFDREMVKDITVHYESSSISSLDEAIQTIIAGTDLQYKLIDSRFVIIYKKDLEGIRSMKKMMEHMEEIVAQDENYIIRPTKRLPLRKFYDNPYRQLKGMVLNITGNIKDDQGNPLIGVNVRVKGTNKGTASDFDGRFELNDVNENDVLVLSYIGYQTVEIPIDGRTSIEVTLISDSELLDEVVVVGYGTQKKSDLTGSVVRANINAFREQPNVSIMQSLQGAVPGLNVGQVNSAGQEPSFSIRGRTTISGETSPLIVVDGIIFRGNIIDLNPNDIETIDILKDASSAAVYGSQAANGVILITTSKSDGKKGKPVINLSSQFSFQRPHKTFEYPDVDYWIEKTERSDFLQSRTPESGYLTSNPNYSFTSRFETADEVRAHANGITTNWYDLVTRNNINTQTHNISINNNTDFSNYYISLGYSKQVGYMVNEDYNRINARINAENKITDWLNIDIQSYLTQSDYSGAEISPRFRYEHNPFMTPYNETGEFVSFPGGQFINPLLSAGADDLNKRLNISGNISAIIKIPFINGLSYRLNYNNNYITGSQYRFEEYGSNFRGSGYKTENRNYNWTADNIIAYNNTFGGRHSVNATFVYGFEKLNFTGTTASASDFINSVLSYNRLQAGNAELYGVSTSAWEESSLYQMGRLFYGYDNKYLLTGTIRRDGFSGFSEENKFGIFPSVAIAWVASQESFIYENVEWLELLKFRISYGTNGNRTIARYQTLATVDGGFNYVTADENPIYTQYANSLASPNLKWETTTGINLGLDFEFQKGRLFGSIDYYNNNTYDLLYNVDIPAISRYSIFPDNLGKIHNHGLEVQLSTMNVQKNDFTWLSTFAFSRNRNELKELLGFDNDGDGREDDLVSEGLFIEQPLSSIYTYEITGDFWQVGDDLPPGFALGSYKIQDLNSDGEFTPADDRRIIGYSDPSYRFSINNEVNYKNWTLRVFINAIQGGKDYYLGLDDLSNWSLSESVFRRNLPKEIDFWSPDNPNARYQSIPITGHFGDRYTQRNFVRLQDVSLSYNFPQDILHNSFAQSIVLYASGKNLATWTKWPGWDPETGEGMTRDGRPVLSSFTLGINVKF
ncbi:SusC/RagA family TonB-linked outer membrane protein [Membranihabitans maritimus]|uniref:SusC/RagA family TonB-linked outer membrane protein n=1 Tax=Membranihabitans maritimus TaxID=2904244 RepID=UPI001F28EA25|nr:TonB-dependent receptor [Membranihabitans maritimus]